MGFYLVSQLLEFIGISILVRWCRFGKPQIFMTILKLPHGGKKFAVYSIASVLSSLPSLKIKK
jgi:hypothetical protein